MKILKTQTLRGPNYWSIRRPKLIVLRLDLEELTDKTSDQIPEFYNGLIQVLPSLVEHYCSPGHRGGFLQRLKDGTLMGHIIEHVALELQELAGMKVGFGRTRETGDRGVYNVVYEYTEEKAGRYAGRAAVRICSSIIKEGSYPLSELVKDLEDLEDLRNNAALGPSTQTIIEAAQAQQIPWFNLSTRSMIQLGYGANQKRIQATLSSNSGILGVELACDKEGTKTILGEAGIPVPQGTVINYLNQLATAIKSVGGFPIVIKPLDGNHGRGITINIASNEEAEIAYDLASQSARNRAVIVERYYAGSDHRILVVDGKVVAVAERIPAHVVGDGTATISTLIEQVNSHPARGIGHDNVLTKINVDQTSLGVLAKQGYDLQSVLPQGEIAYLKATANLSTGGIAIDRTDDIHPQNVWIAERTAKIIGLDIAGIDVVTPDITQPITKLDGVIVEVNAAPGFRMHACPSQGKPRPVGKAVLDMLYPQASDSRIPIVAITGTNGKTTTTRMTAHIFRQTGKVVGYTSTDGVYIGDYLAEKGDNTGPYSAKMILQDPTVEIAILETARGGLLRAGLAFDRSDVGIVLNVAADHLGLGDINTIEQMAKVKGVIAETVSADGYAILNADDPLVAAMADRVTSQVAYFSLEPENKIIQEHINNQGLAAVYEQGQITILKGKLTIRLEEAINCPVTMGGMAPFMIANALAASLAAFCQGIDVNLIRQGLRTFNPSDQQTPGRMNLFQVADYHVLIDYAHNPHGYEAVGEFVQNWQGKKIGIIGGAGDRRDTDLQLLGEIAVKFFDHIIIKEDEDKRGRESGEAATIIAQGVTKINSDFVFETILDENLAFETTLKSAPTGSLVVIFPEKVSQAIKTVKRYI
ncbi:MAG: cyanophycin synthetase [Cyanobacteria bacterium J06642_3]